MSASKITFKRFRYIATVQKGKLPLNGDSSGDLEMVPYLTMEYLRGEIAAPLLVQKDSRALMADDGDLLLLWDGSNAGEFFRAKRGLVSTTSAVVIPRGIDCKYFYWACKAFEHRIRAETVGMGIPHVNTEYLANLDIPVPEVPRQQAIADYLDRETARIDALIAAKERLLALLAEKRQALITRAVTRGLDPNVPLRDSGIPWLGMIPAHWKTLRIAWLFRERDLRGEPDLPLLEVSINVGVVLREFSADKIESTAADFSTYKVARQGDVVFNKMRMWQGAVGVAPEEGLVSPDYVVAAPNGELLPEYARLLFRTPIFSAECGRRSHGIVWDRLRLYWEEFRDISVPVPPLDEQTAVVAHVAQGTRKLDDLAAATNRTIALLKERRAALIAAAVTGQIHIPSEAVA